MLSAIVFKYFPWISHVYLLNGHYTQYSALFRLTFNEIFNTELFFSPWWQNVKHNVKLLKLFNQSNNLFLFYSKLMFLIRKTICILLFTAKRTLIQGSKLCFGRMDYIVTIWDLVVLELQMYLVMGLCKTRWSCATLHPQRNMGRVKTRRDSLVWLVSLCFKKRVWITSFHHTCLSALNLWHVLNECRG